MFHWFCFSSFQTLVQCCFSPSAPSLHVGTAEATECSRSRIRMEKWPLLRVWWDLAPLLCRRPHEPVEAALVCPEEWSLHVVPHQAGGTEVRLALQKRRRHVDAFTPQLETPLVCASRIQADVLWEWQRGKAEGDNWYQKGKVSEELILLIPSICSKLKMKWLVQPVHPSTGLQ